MIDLTGVDILLGTFALLFTCVMGYLVVMEIIEDYRFNRDRDKHDNRGTHYEPPAHRRFREEAERNGKDQSQ